MLNFLMEWMVAAVAAWGLGETCRHGSLFENLRARLEARGGLLHEWISCGFCFSHWTAALTSALAVALFEAEVGPETGLRLFLVWVCATRLSNVLNDVFYPTSRLDKEPVIEYQDHDEQS